MVYLPPPHLASPTRPSYAQSYTDILATHRRSPLTSASSIIILVAPDVDALCAARMLADLFKQDDVMHRIVPVSGIAELERVRDDLLSYSEVGLGFNPIWLLGLINETATHPHTTQYGLSPRPPLRTMVRRIQQETLCARHRLFTTAEPRQSLWGGRGLSPY